MLFIKASLVSFIGLDTSVGCVRNKKSIGSYVQKIKTVCCICRDLRKTIFHIQMMHDSTSFLFVSFTQPNVCKTYTGV